MNLNLQRHHDEGRGRSGLTGMTAYEHALVLMLVVVSVALGWGLASLVAKISGAGAAL